MDGEVGDTVAGLGVVPHWGLTLGSGRKLQESLTLPCPFQVGFVNSLKFSAAGDFLVAGLGQEHRYRPSSPALPGGTGPPSTGLGEG